VNNREKNFTRDRLKRRIAAIDETIDRYLAELDRADRQAEVIGVPVPITFLGRHWSALKERRERARVRAILYGMPDRELKDLGLTRNEIESVMVYDSGERVRAYPKQNRFRG
jgi:uncharacterized protein YjiS (DUF1127 family)